MISFGILFTVLLALATMLLVLPARCHGGYAAATTRDALNIEFYRRRLEELAVDETQGLVGEHGLPIEELREELQQNLLVDVPTVQPVEPTLMTLWVLAPGVVALVTITLALYAWTGGIPQVWRWQQTVDAMPALRTRIMDSGARQLSPNDLARLAVGLRASLQRQPDNIQNWLFLGHIGVALGNAAMATQAFGRAYQLAPDDAVIDLDYAEVLIRSTDAGDNQEGVRIMQRRVKQQPDNLAALNLLAIGEYQQNNVVQALACWRHMVTLLPANDLRVDAIGRTIAQAEAQSGLATVKLHVSVTLSPDAAAQLPANGTVFISVTDGKSTLPMAVKSLPLSRFPLSLTLDDSNAMTPARVFSPQQQVKIRVRIAKDGSAEAKRGDWFGESPMLNMNSIGQIAVHIDQQMP
ncbi:c-type cytochrome biogenesis protein CcmI [Acerihabitans sp. TG2]|uniref:c-type cytochrome biogenesis protein CcmI n=1 Tax=Acerihabitans sp. TG2 TaxID=3096008 RepID=UPI002B221EFB|nr:c-type cytochrome biogenesis protein CcmI [Acerihabitans sp. TG2]MEA9389104.1 c-type cytochrome biogenesis protein CcmI [Acerihabitans sp. TG2]